MFSIVAANSPLPQGKGQGFGFQVSVFGRQDPVLLWELALQAN